MAIEFHGHEIRKYRGPVSVRTHHRPPQVQGTCAGYPRHGISRHVEKEEEEEEMQSPSRAHLPHNPMVPAGPHRSGPRSTRGVFVPTRPAQHHGGGSPLCLLPIVPWPTQRARTPAPHTNRTPQGTDRAARRSAGSTSGMVHHPPLGEVWALSPPGTTNGQRLAGRSWGLGP